MHPDVAAALERAVAAGATPMRPVEVMPWGQTIACVPDSNGFLVERCTPMASINRRPYVQPRHRRC